MFKTITTGTNHVRFITSVTTPAFNAKRNKHNSQSFKLKKALLISKLSRYGFERYRHPELNNSQLEQMIRGRGTDFDSMMHFHNLHKGFEKNVAKTFIEHGVDVKVVNRISINKYLINWADMLVPIGGDGTFLLAAGRSSSLFSQNPNKIPVAGFNSDPKRSEGRLMLPKEYSSDINSGVKRILNGDFKWMDRSRIRITLLGSNFTKPLDLHEHCISAMEKNELIPENLNELESNKFKATSKITVPYLALNEVFIGETFSARVSHLQLKIDQSENYTKTKCSGMCLSTGTGSTSWLTSINRISAKNVEDIINILPIDKKIIDQIKCKEICNEYNQKLVFAPDDPRMCYSIREQICANVWPNPKGLESKGFAKSMLVKSICLDASLVIDGSISYQFNEGSKAIFELRPEDSLLTISMD